VTIEHLLTEQNNLLRDVLDRLGRLVTLGEKNAGGMASGEPELLAAPVTGANADVFHALWRNSNQPVCGVTSRSARSSAAVDMTRAVPESRIPRGQHCAGNGCAGAFLRSSKHDYTRCLSTADSPQGPSI
jgi:hypothetical protein